MESIFTKDQPVLPSLCDYSANLSISSVASLFMDMAMYHAETLGIGFTGFNERGLFWVAVKTRIKILKKVPMAKMVQISTWPEEAGGFKCNRDYEITFEGEPVALGKTEWAIIDATTHRPQKSQGIYPEGLEIIDKNSIPEPFLNLKGDFENGTLLFRPVCVQFPFLHFQRIPKDGQHFPASLALRVFLPVGGNTNRPFPACFGALLGNERFPGIPVRKT